MANAQLMEEELQQSVVLSEEDADFEEENAVRDDTIVETAVDANLHSDTGSKAHEKESNPPGEGDHEEGGGDDIPVGANGTNQQDNIEPDQPNEEDPDNEHDESESGGEDIHDEDEAFNSDADALEDEDEEGPNFPPHSDARRSVDSSEEDEQQIEAEDEEDEEDDEDDEDEGVGAVKIKPGETDDEEDSDSDPSDGSDSAFSDRGSGVDSDDAIDNDDEDEDIDDFDAVDLPAHDEEESDPESEAGSAHENMEIEGDVDINGDGENEGDVPLSARRSSAPQIARDLLPSHRGLNKPDSHSMFNQLVLDEDPMDGSRVLRKRKTSSTEAEEDIMSLRKRRKNASDESTHDDVVLEPANSGETSTRQRSARSLRLKVSNSPPSCTIVKKTRFSLTIRLRVNPADLGQILSQKPKSSKKRSRGRTINSQRPRAATSRDSATTATNEPSIMAPFASGFSQPFYSFYDKETDELKGKPYGGILTEEQANTTKTLPTKDDRKRFDEAKQKAEEGWRNRLLTMQAEPEVSAKKSKKTSCPVSQIECIEFGGWEIDTWYAAPYPEEYSRNRVLYICEFCLKYMNSDYVAWRHKLKCPAKHPPGDEIYRYGSISFFEVDGRKNPVYCQNLCLLAKLFLGSKTLYYDVEPFLFYVLCEYDELGYHFVGYFSKEKRVSSQNNVSCILTLPIHQRKGYGHLLIDFSYLLTRVEEKSGSPEKPLSDMGLVSYRNYWRLVLCKYFVEHVPEDKTRKFGISIRRISDDTGMTPDDVITALEGLRFLVRDPVSHMYAFRVDVPYCQKEVAKWEAKKYVKLHPRALTWTPYVMGRANATNFELGPELNTMAAREDDEESESARAIIDDAGPLDDLAVVNNSTRKILVDGEPVVLESTEPNDNIATGAMALAQPFSVSMERGSHHPSQQCESHRHVSDINNDEHDWQQQYEDIPVTRFQVFPPISKRLGMSRGGSHMVRSTLGRGSSTVRTPAQSRSRGRGRRPGGGSARRSAQKRANPTRKTGGTGRGPGRWPKGTKKSDYGNAASGPGMPPAWLEKQRQKNPSMSDADEENELLDTVQVQVGRANRNDANKGKGVEWTLAAFEVKDFAHSESVIQSSASGTNGITADATVDDPASAEAVTTNQVEKHEEIDVPNEDK